MKRPLSKKQIGIRWSWVNMGEPWFYSTAFWRSFRSCEIAMNFAWTYTPVHQSTNTLILLIDSLANLQLADQMDGAWQFVEKTVSMHDMITNWLELHILYIYIPILHVLIYLIYCTTVAHTSILSFLQSDFTRTKIAVFFTFYYWVISLNYWVMVVFTSSLQLFTAF